MDTTSQIADEGARYTEKEKRHACHSSLKDFTTSLTDTQAGTGGNMHNFDDWDIPLNFKDGRRPDEVDFWNNEEPSWVNDDTSTGPVPRVHPLLRRDHSQRHHNNHQVQAYNRRRCQDHRLAEPRLRRPMQLSDLDPEQHLKVMLNQKEIRIGFQLKTG